MSAATRVKLEPACSEQAGLAKRIDAAMERIALRVADDDVIEQFDVDDLRGIAEFASDVNVGRARGRIAAGMVVRDNKSAAACDDRSAKDFTAGNQRRIHRAERN